MYHKTRSVTVVLFLVSEVFAVLQLGTAASLSSALLPKWHIHVVNGLSKVTLFVHCKSKDDDLGVHNLVTRGDEFQWTFQVNFWATTLYWCYLKKPNADVSFESFWVEQTHMWLQYRCTDKNCIWTAKDDGIYLRNNPDGVDERIHEWINET